MQLHKPIEEFTEKEKTLYHEAAHAVAAWFLKVPIEKVIVFVERGTWKGRVTPGKVPQHIQDGMDSPPFTPEQLEYMRNQATMLLVGREIDLILGRDDTYHQDDEHQVSYCLAPRIAHGGGPEQLVACVERMRSRAARFLANTRHQRAIRSVAMELGHRSVMSTDEVGRIVLRSLRFSIVRFLADLFNLLSKCSIYNCLLKCVLPRKNGASREEREARREADWELVDKWCSMNAVIAFAAVLAPSLVSITGPIQSLVRLALCTWTVLRLYDLAVHGVNVAIFDRYRAEEAGEDYEVAGHERLVVLALVNYAEIVFWFSAIHRAFPELFVCTGHQVLQPSTFWGSLYLSLATMSLLGAGNIQPTNTCGLVLLLLQTAFGLFMSLLILARFVGMMRPPETRGARDRRRRG